MIAASILREADPSRLTKRLYFAPEILVLLSGADPARVRPLSAYSSVIAHLKPIGKVSLYVRQEEADAARSKLRDVLRAVQ